MGRPENTQEKVTIDREHTMQIGLLDLLAQAIGDARPDSEKLEILDQLLGYSDIHFMSEQLMMRQHSYEGHDEHVAEHDILIEMLRDVKASMTQDPARFEGTQITALRKRLLDHIAVEDHRFDEFLQSVKRSRRQI